MPSIPPVLLSILSLLLLLFSVVNSQTNFTAYINVELSHGGIIRGVEETVNIDGVPIRVNRFLGIPYALPPIGKLRFAPPIEHPGWNGIRDAVKLSATCWQYIFTGFDAVNPAGRMWINNTEMNEDCLYLNVWQPTNSVKSRQPLPVMVWIYGGGFTSGSANLQVYNGAILAATQNVIIVSMQYRVGAFGFLRLDPSLDSDNNNNNNTTNSTSSLSDKEIALGNQGILDQYMALLWLKNNIQRFNGDPNQVTVFGESAGAVSISILWLSPLVQPYFKRAILQSGSLYARWGLDEPYEAHEKAVEFALACKCKSPSLDRRASLACLQELDPLTLVNQLDSIHEAIGKRRYNILHKCLHPNTFTSESVLLGQSGSSRLYFDVPFQPVIDGYVIPKHPDLIFNTKNTSQFKNQPELLIGINENEAMYFLLPGISIKNAQFIYDNGSILMPSAIELAGKRKPFRPKGEIADFYWITTTQILEEAQMRPGLAKLPAYYYNLPLQSTPENGYADPDTMMMTGEELLRRLDELAGDLDFVCPTLNFADQVARIPGAKVYLYHFKKRTQSLPVPKWTGVMHGYEIEYIFGMPKDPVFSSEFYGFTEDEGMLSSRLMKLWTNFAKTGNPSRSETGEVINPQWPLYRRSDDLLTDDYDHLVITDQLTPGKGLRRDRCKFWLHEMKDLSKILQTTCKLSSKGIRITGNYNSLVSGLWLILLSFAHISFYMLS
ncbi:unnamed protein product [Trichobilharzia szidati]|nr:unnamed protein product [Trichobilharzia szidati]